MKTYPAILKSKSESDTRIMLAYNKNEAARISSEPIDLFGGFNFDTSDAWENITADYLRNTCGKVENKEHADFIVKLAEGAGLGCGKFNELRDGYFCTDGNMLLFTISESTAKNKGEKLITLPLPPKEPEVKEWPQVGDIAIYSSHEKPMHHEDCNLDEHCIVDTWRNGDKLIVIATVTIHGKRTPVVQNDRTQEVSSIRTKLIKKPPTPEEELRDELMDATIKSMSDDSYDLTHNAYYLISGLMKKYDIKKKPE